MLQAMFSGVSGLQAYQTGLDVIGNNIANVNTIGFKASDVTYEDQFSQLLHAAARPGNNTGGENPAQVGLGVMVGAIDTMQTQGNLQTTGKSTDMAIQGNGFFMVGSGNNVFYTRDGSFDLDSNGVLSNPANGLSLLGYTADANGKIDTTQQITSNSVLKIPIGTLTSVKQSTTAAFQGNLDASSALQSTTATLSGPLDPTSTPAPFNTTVYDSLGNPHTLQVTFSNPVVPPGAGAPAGAKQQWSVTMALDGVDTQATVYAVPGSGSSSQFIFANASGTLGSKLQLNGVGTGGAPNFPLTIDLSGLTDTSSVTSSADGQDLPTKIASTQISLSGNLNLDNAPSPITTTVYDASGNAYTITTTLSNPTYNPTGTGVPTGATASYDVKIVNTTSGTTLYDSTTAANNESKAYFVPGQGFVLANHTNGTVLGSVIQLSGASIGADNQGQQVVSGLPLSVDLSKLTTTTATSAADGQAGTTGTQPTWQTSTTLYDSLGVGHLVDFTFTRALVGTGAPSNAAGRWEWTATENGQTVATSASQGNQPLYFDSQGNLIDTNAQNVTVTPKSGGASFNVAVNFSGLTQLSGSSSVTAVSQDGFPVGTLQSYSIAQDGVITGIFSNGQSRALGQVAMASFFDPSGLQKEGQNLYSVSNNSGLAQIGQPNTAGRGNINTGFVEMSNVDLSSEFTNLIVTERGFQANTRIITTVDTMLQDVLNLKQG